MRTGTQCPGQKTQCPSGRAGDGCDTGSRSTGHADAHPAGPVALAPGLHPSPVLARRRCARRVSLIGRRHTATRSPSPRARAPSRLPLRHGRTLRGSVRRRPSLRLAIRVRGRAEATRERQKGCEGEQPLCPLARPQQIQMPFLSDSVHTLRDPGRDAA